MLLAAGSLTGCGVATEIAVAGYPDHVGSAPKDLQAVDVTVRSADGTQLASWWVDAPSPAPTVVLLHGITDNRRRMIPRMRLFRDAGFAVLAVDGRGHGESGSETIGYGSVERYDAIAAVAFVRAERPNARVGVVGISLGGAGAALAGADLGADAVVLESVFPSFDIAARHRTEVFLGPLGKPALGLVRSTLEKRLGQPLDAIAPLEGVALLGVPVLVAGGMRDRFVPPDETRRLHAAAGANGELWLMQGAGHVDLYRRDPEGYRRRVLGFLRNQLVLI